MKTDTRTIFLLQKTAYSGLGMFDAGLLVLDGPWLV